MTTEIHKGLAGIVVDETAISSVMPELAALTYRGYPVAELAENCRFEEVAWLIWTGELPSAEELRAFEAKERSQRAVSADMIALLRLMPKASHPMDSLRTAVSFLGQEDTDAWNLDQVALLDKSIALMAKLPTIMAADSRLRKGLEPIAPRTDLSFAENIFHMCFGEVPDARLVRAFDLSLTCYAEHSFNASTFTARTIVSSLSDIYSCVAGAIGSLKGPLHGGANEAVMHMLQEIDSPEQAEDWLRGKLARKELVMGFGHRVYRKGDSRVPIMRQALEDIVAAVGGEGEKYLEIGRVIEKIMIEEKGIHPNLDWPTGPAYYLMGFDIPIFTPIFATARITGWTAHIREQLAANKLIRPLSAYIGAKERHL